MLLIALVSLGGATVTAQRPDQTDKNENKSYPPGSAWTLSWPLGNHIESTIDTVLYNYQRQFIQVLNSDAFATTGQFKIGRAHV